MSGEPDGVHARILRWLEAAKEHEEIFHEGPIGKILAKDADGQFLTSPGQVMEILFNDGPACAETILAYLRTNADPLALEDYGGDLFRQSCAVAADGTLDLAVLDRWEARYKSALSVLPGLQSKLDGIRAAQFALDKAKANKRAVLDHIRRSPATLFVQHDPMMATEKLFALPDATGAIRALLEEVAGNPDLVDSIQKIVVNYIREKIGITDDRASEYLAFLAGHEETLAVLFGETKMQALRNIAADLQRCPPPPPMKPEIRDGRLPTSAPRGGWRRLFGA